MRSIGQHNGLIGSVVICLEGVPTTSVRGDGHRWLLAVSFSLGFPNGLLPSHLHVCLLDSCPPLFYICNWLFSLLLSPWTMGVFVFDAYLLYTSSIKNIDENS